MEEISSYNRQKKLSTIGFIIDLPNFILVLVFAILSSSLIVWLDFIDSLCLVITECVVILQSKKLTKDLKFKYNYGTSKVEALTTILCEGIAILGLICIVAISIIKIINPTKSSDLIIYVVILKIINVLIDLIFLKKQYKINKASPTKLIEREYVSSINALAFDALALFSLFIIWIFRNQYFSWYITPILSIIISIIFLAIYIKHIKNAVDELSDKTLPEKLQLKILRVVANHEKEYEYFNSIKSHYSGVEIIIDISICFFDNTSYKQIAEFQKTLQNELSEELGRCRVSLII